MSWKKKPIIIGTWQDVVVTAALEITLFQKTVAVEVDDNRIILPGGVTCPYKDKQCVDTIYVYTFLGIC